MADRVAFSLFGLDVYWYGVFIAVGLLLAALLMLRREKRLGLKKDTSIDLLLWTLPVAVVCARLYYIAFSWDMFRGNLRAMLDVRGGGLAIYGGVIGGFFCLVVFSRVRKVPLSSLVDLAAPSLALGQAIGRWGNYTNAEAFGRPVARAWMEFFPFAVWIEEDSLWHYATFFYESVWCLLTAAGLVLAEKLGKMRRSGDVCWWYLALYGAERGFVEGLRTDSLYFMGARVSQLLSAALLAASAAVFALRAVGAKGRGAYLWLLGSACALISPWCGGGAATAALLAAGLICAFGAYSQGDAQSKETNDGGGHEQSIVH